MADQVVEGQQNVDGVVEKDGKHPETVSWQQHVAAKETISNKLDKATQKVSDLEEQVKQGVSADEHTRVKTELEEANKKLQTTSDELKTTKDATLAEKRDSLISKGVSEDKVKDMTVEQLDGIIGALDGFKPKADMASGGGGSKGLGDMSPKERVIEGDRRLREANK